MHNAFSGGLVSKQEIESGGFKVLYKFSGFLLLLGLTQTIHNFATSISYMKNPSVPYVGNTQ